MTSSRLLVGLGSVFAGLTVVLAVLGLVYSPVALVPAAGFFVVTYVVWYQLSGRLGKRVRRRAQTAHTTNARGGQRGGFGADFRRDRTGRGAGRRRADGFGRDARERRRRRSKNTPSAAEAYRTLGLDPGASEAAVRSAYREKVKTVHPDTEGGDERRFRRVNEAYERLTE